MTDIIDLRSDTVTKPTAEMREAMARAEVGDDCYGEDPTLNELEAVAAELVGKEDAIYVPSGTMGNLVALMSHTHKGDEIVMDAHAHIYEFEVGGFSALAGLSPRLVQTQMGVMTPEGLAGALRTPYSAFPPTTLLCLENTNNDAGGAVMSSAQMAAVTGLAREHGLAVHLDGARVFNAATALGVDVKELTQHVDSVTFCLSKALSAPVGSLLAGSAEFIERARRARRMVGGGLRQAGVLAAAGLVALRTMTQRLQEDHDNALALAQGLAGIQKLGINLNTVQTNMVMVDLTGLGMDSAQVLERMGCYGIKANPRGPSRIRLVTHRHITLRSVERVVAAFEEIAA